ncbi:MAG: N-acetylornithine carbamoyltransferase [Polyangia bacterium]
MKRDFLDMTDLAPAEIDALLDQAEQLQQGTASRDLGDALHRRVLAMIFFDPSLRTRTSFEVAMHLHGGHALVLEPGRGSWPLETRRGAVMDGTTVEHIADAARVLGRYADALAVRAFPKGTDWSVEREDRLIRDFAEYCEKPVINLESVRRHPCQGLADALTLRQKLGPKKEALRGRRFVLTWAYHPKPLPTAVPASAALAAAHLGMEVVLAHPPGYELDGDDLAALHASCAASGGSLRIEHDPDAALEGAEAVYVKSWGALGAFGRPADEAVLRAPHRHWTFSTERLRRTRDGRAVVMHCLPVRRNVEVQDAVLDGPSSAVVDQAENRLHVQRALLLHLLTGPSARSQKETT